MNTKTCVRWVGFTLLAGMVIFGCGEPNQPVGSSSAQLGGTGKLGVLLKVLVGKNPAAAQAHRAMPRQLVTLRTKSVNGKQQVVLDALIQAKPAAVAKLAALGVEVRTITPSGIITATVPLNKVTAVAAIADVQRIEAAKRMRKFNDLSNAAFVEGCGSSVCTGMNNGGAKTGAGVIVGIIDSGIDWTHGDFIDDITGTTRILYYWDQSDVDDDALPTGAGWSFSYGHEYSSVEINSDLDQGAAAWDATADDYTWPNMKASAQDTDGHGTHVAGTAAGDGSASGFKGAAPAAQIIFVKFDFDGDRNSDAAIIDGVDYIFKRAAEEGKPAVINMSLGSDFGPHDGSTLEERGISDLTGAGKVVVVAAGNPGNNNWSDRLGWGFAMHGSGELTTDAITFRFPTYDTAAADNYVFFDFWYPAGNKCRVFITTPGGVTYPQSTSGASKRTWVTGSSYTGFNTGEGALLVGNGGDQLDWGTNTSDHEAYVEISNYWNVNPAVGEFEIRFEPADSRSTCAGTYHAWYGTSTSLTRAYSAEATPRDATPKFGGRESDNAVTIGSPASADGVIAVAAYQTRNEWQYVYGTTCDADGNTSATPMTQTYDDAPIGYYDGFYIGELAYFSGRGPRRDGVLKPEIAAPGVGIASALSHFVLRAEWAARCIDYWETDGLYHFGTNRALLGNNGKVEGTVMQGTSMACPNATGAVALMLQAKADIDDDCLRALFALGAKKDSVTETHTFAAHTTGTDTDDRATPNGDWGHGKMDIDATLALLADAANLPAACQGAAPPPPPPPCEPTDLSCDDNVDNDCDGLVDGDDEDECPPPPPPPPGCTAKGDACTVDSECCSNACLGKPGKTKCR